MKVKIRDLDKDLRAMGVIAKIFMSSVPKKKGKAHNSQPSNPSAWNRTKKLPNSKYVPRGDGTDLRILVLESENRNRSKLVPGILWIHGGGYALGSPERILYLMPKVILKERESVIVSPEYRLSVEKPYPAALEDCYQTLVWMKDHAKELGIRDDQIFVGGESAGGGLAIALCLYARDKAEVNVAFQMPMYPMIDDRLTTDSMKDNNAPIWNVKQNIAAWNLYLEGVDRENVPQYAAPARETDYRNLPPAVTFIGGVDAFRDETLEYVEHLKQAGIPVDFKLFKGSFHSSEAMAPWAKSSKEAVEFFMSSYDYACNNYFRPQKQGETK